MKTKIIDAVASVLTTFLFGCLGFWIGAATALCSNGILYLIGSDYSFDLLKSAYVVFVIGAIFAILSLTKK